MLLPNGASMPRSALRYTVLMPRVEVMPMRATMFNGDAARHIDERRCLYEARRVMIQHAR